MAIWYVDPFSISTNGIGTYANPFGVGNGVYLDAYVNNGDEIRILGKDVTTLASSSCVLKVFRINDGTTQYAKTGTTNFALKIVSGSPGTGTGTLLYCLELDMFCQVNYDSGMYCYYINGYTSEFAHKLNKLNIAMNTNLTFYNISTSIFNYANYKHVCCFNSKRQYLTISDNWTSATTRSTRTNKIMSLLAWGNNTNSYYTYFFNYIFDSIIDCSNTTVITNCLQPSYVDLIYFSNVKNCVITFKKFNAIYNIAQSSNFILFNGQQSLNNTLNITDFIVPTIGQTTNYYSYRINNQNSYANETTTDIINITNFITGPYDYGLDLTINTHPNVILTIDNLIVNSQAAEPVHGNSTNVYSFIHYTSLGNNYNSKLTFNLGKILLVDAVYNNNMYPIFGANFKKFYVFSEKHRFYVKSNKIEINLLSNFDVIYKNPIDAINVNYYDDNIIPLVAPYLNEDNVDFSKYNFSTNLSSKTQFKNTTTGEYYIKNTTGYDMDIYNTIKYSSQPYPSRELILTTSDNYYLNFLGNFSTTPGITINSNGNKVSYLAIFNNQISLSNTSYANIIKVYNDYITYKTISPAITMNIDVSKATLLYPKSSYLYKHVLSVQAGKNYNLSFSIFGENFDNSSSKVNINIIDNNNIYPVTITGSYTTGWEHINFINYNCTANQNLTIVFEVFINNLKQKLTLSDIILSQIN